MTVCCFVAIGFLFIIIAWLIRSNDHSFTRIHELTAALRMEGAPDAPCELCKSECFYGCQCSCHRTRVEYLNERYNELLERTYREYPHTTSSFLSRF